ncbi:hypothetical protein BDF21DRAFT_418017 [Thamnidium elegans]|nr:hypothetical protein BDF21DRAFT_418017 [Thamnidium elegans]
MPNGNEKGIFRRVPRYTVKYIENTVIATCYNTFFFISPVNKMYKPGVVLDLSAL